MSKIDWNEVQESNALILKMNEWNEVIFLGNGLQDTIDLYDEKSQKMKKVKRYIFTVSDLKDKEVKELSIIQTRLITKLKPFVPLKEKHFRLRKKQIGITEYDIDYDVELIE